MEFKPNRAMFYLTFWVGVAVMLAALILSFTLKMPSNLRFTVTSAIGLAGLGLNKLADKFRPKA